MASAKVKAINEQICRDLTATFVNALESGIVPWDKPWVKTESGYVGSSGKSYGILNTILCMLGGHEPGEFVTYNELKARGGKFIETEDGSKQTPTIIVFRKRLEYDKKDANGNVITDKDGNPVKGAYFFLKTSKVWRVGTQVDCPTKYTKKIEKKHVNQIADAEKIALDYISREGIKVVHENQNRAFYRPSDDLVNVPHIDNFKSSEGYYGTLFHELGHSTGAEHRLKRDIKNVFGDHLYSKEELVAELCSAIILHDNGWNTPKTDKNNIAYLQSWAKSLKSDPTIVEWAMTKATAAVKRIYGKN